MSLWERLNERRGHLNTGLCLAPWLRPAGRAGQALSAMKVKKTPLLAGSSLGRYWNGGNVPTAGTNPPYENNASQPFWFPCRLNVVFFGTGQNSANETGPPKGGPIRQYAVKRKHCLHPDACNMSFGPFRHCLKLFL